MSKRILLICVIVTVGMLSGIAALSAQDALQSQIDAIKAVLPKFAIPMREVGDRFQNMYFAAQGGNWGLAAYMSKYMNNSMNPASLTKPKEYPVWKNFYESGFAPVNSAIQAQDFKAFTTAYDNAIQSCNACHILMGYSFIEVVKQKTPSDYGIDYTVASKATDVPK
jgi:hypothetical protein